MIERVVTLFLDGVGLGEDDPQVNPFAGARLPVLQALLDGARLTRANAGLSTRSASLVALDAQLGVSGVPQSGTGQTTLLTGLNAAALLGYHDGPYPHPSLHPMLRRGSLFRRLLAVRRPAAFANAYTEPFLSRVRRGTQRLSANARAALLAGLKLRGAAELSAGRAVSALLTNDYFRRSGYMVPEVSPAAAGAQLAQLSGDHDLTFFEFWHTDVAGHRQDWQLALDVLATLDEFIGGLMTALNMERCLVLIVGDHGNLEDLRTSKHTLNPALGLLVGSEHRQLAERLHSLADVTPAVLSALGAGQ